MTNVPDNIRQCWKELYILFDENYLMDGSDSAWEKYWLKVAEIIKTYGDDVPLLEITTAIAHMIELYCNQRKTGNKILVWSADENYPHPKSEGVKS